MLAVTGLWLVSTSARAQEALPWEGPLQTIQASLTGPIARTIAIVAMAATGGMLAFGGELGDFTKRMCMVVLAAAVMMLAAQFIGALFG